MSIIDGGLAALVVQEFSKEIRDIHKETLRLGLSDAIHRYLSIPPESNIEVPKALINAFNRGSKFSPDSRERIFEASKTLAFQLTMYCQQTDLPVPSWTRELTHMDVHENNDQDKFREIWTLINDVNNDKEVSSQRTLAQTSRNQASCIAGVCRVLYTSWIQEVKGMSNFLNDRTLESQQKALLDFTIISREDFLSWAQQLFSYFSTITEESDHLKDQHTKIVSYSAVRTYRHAWENLIISNCDQIFEEIRKKVDDPRFTRSIRTEIFYRSNQATNVDDLRLKPLKSMLSRMAMKIDAETSSLSEGTSRNQIQRTSSSTNEALMETHPIHPTRQLPDKILQIQPNAYEDVSRIAEAFRTGASVIVNVSQLENDVATRITDVALGLALAASGTLEKIASGVFIITRSEITSDLSAISDSQLRLN